ncbi:hypothetical protein MMC07_003924 [Pseudocyphellaria aurata]|nr:hypothetical protein [Pseudocyphellaria aurata]
MSHSKRNTSLAFFTSHERDLLKSSWGSQSTRLSRDSFLPFASCQLCLQIARDPAACAFNGDIFCRECAVSNLLAQKKEIKRLEKEDEKRRIEDLEGEMERGEEERGRAIIDFERVMMGLEGGGKKTAAVAASEELELERKGDKSSKRKFELDEDEMLKNARAERVKARRLLDEEKSSKPTLPSFWVPSLTPSSNANVNHSTPKASKLSPLCPSSSTNPHPFSLKSLVSIKFTTADSKSSSNEVPTLICPACKKVLSNTLKAMLAVPCGHVLCKPCAGKFLVPTKGPPDPHAPDQENHISCYVCDADLSGKVPTKRTKDDVKGAAKDGGRPGLVEINSEGTGFASGGKNMAKRQGVAFQC